MFAQLHLKKKEKEIPGVRKLHCDMYTCFGEKNTQIVAQYKH